MRRRRNRGSATTQTVFVLLSFLGSTTAEILAYGKSLARFIDIPAGFGPRVPVEGLDGYLVMAEPNVFACAGPLTVRNTTSGQQPSFVLIQRSLPVTDNIGEAQQVAVTCTFEQKVRVAAASGFKLAVIFDSVDEPLVRMKSQNNAGITIPSVFLNLRSGVALAELIASAPSEIGIRIIVDNSDPALFLDSFNTTMLGLIVGFLFVVLVCGTLLLCTNHRHARLLPVKNEVLPLSDVLALPEVTVGTHASLENENCPICLEDYEQGERLRLLPCRHAFHTDCIAPWLTERQHRCPCCKEVVLPSASHPLLSRSSADTEQGGGGRGVINDSPEALVVVHTGDEEQGAPAVLGNRQG